MQVAEMKNMVYSHDKSARGQGCALLPDVKGSLQKSPFLGVLEGIIRKG
jgi:hypothetical protein